MASEVERAYIAGLVDGEGAIYVQKGNSDGTVLQPILDITNNNRDCLLYVQEFYGGSTLTWRRGMSHKLRFFTPQAIQPILQDIFPYLIVKKEVAKIMLSFCESRLMRRHESYTKDELVWYRALRTLNNA